jgi:hypothetical protein
MILQDDNHTRPTVSRYVNIHVNTRVDGKPIPNYADSVKRVIMPADMDVFRIHISTSYLLDGAIPFSSYRRIINAATIVAPSIVSFLSVSDTPQRTLADGYKMNDVLTAIILNPLDATQVIEHFSVAPPLILDRRGQNAIMRDDLYLSSFVPNITTSGSGQSVTRIAHICFEGYLK